MWSFMVIIVLPLFGFFSYLIQSFKDVRIQQLRSNASIESFNIGVLCGLARLDKGQCYMMVFAPVVELSGDKFGSVIHPDHLRQSAAAGLVPV